MKRRKWRKEGNCFGLKPDVIFLSYVDAMNDVGQKAQGHLVKRAQPTGLIIFTPKRANRTPS